ncbi:MAG: SDR family oxidoreductase [Proteobacteria bacterium]|nr:SDR family oxidoreductase [Pseudomonadota bacterium]MBI3497177.1 SDR family oxidoreductase [Pseudomonadota bacterium]
MGQAAAGGRGTDLVTGGAGFIGSHVVDALLRRGRRVRVVDNFATGRPANLGQHQGNPALTVIEADVADMEAMRKAAAGTERVFHLAALADIVPSIQRPEAYFRANVDGTFAALEASRAAGVRRFVYTASSSCYGLAEVFPTPETAQIDTRYPYALTKYLGERLVLHWASVYGLPALSLRLFNVYGPRARTSGTYGAVFGVFLAQKLAGKPMTVVGDGEQTRDFTFVTDVARAFLMAGESDRSGEVYNVGTGRPQSVNRLVELLGASGVEHLPKRPGEPDCTHADTRRIERDLGWRVEVSFEEGVQRMLEVIEHWREAPVWSKDKIAEATTDWFKYLGAPGAGTGHGR